VRYLVIALLAVTIVGCQNDGKSGGVQLVEVPAGTTDVAALVRDASQRAQAAHRRLVVYVGATWCEPCQEMHAALAAHRLDQAFPDLTLLMFDLDRDGDALAQAGYESEYIPLFAIPTAEGRSSSHRAMGGKKGEDNVPLLAGKLQALLASGV
jgi:hypothetical protein